MLSFPPRKTYVAPAIELVTSFCNDLGFDPETVARARLAAHELTENVVKYSQGDQDQCRLRVRSRPLASGSGIRLSITTENPVAPERLAEVDAYLRRLERAANPDQFYDARIAESAKRELGSGLGLARIRSEALMEVSHRTESGKLRVTASVILIGGPVNP